MRSTSSSAWAGYLCRYGDWWFKTLLSVEKEHMGENFANVRQLTRFAPLARHLSGAFGLKPRPLRRGG